jgi:nucleotide-binding universal stress UspA family protein
MSSELPTGDDVRPLVARIVVPVDGSPFAERALPVAAHLAEALDAPLHLLEVVAGTGRTEPAMHHLHDLARRHGAASWEAVRGDDPAAGIVAVTQASPRGLACLATHGRDRSGAVLGSVAAAVLDRATGPLMLVGPRARPPCAADAPVVVAVDGSPDDREVVSVAAEWSAALRRRLVVATVAEAAPGPLEPALGRRQMRTASDPEAYVATLAAAARRPGCAVETSVAHDPFGVRSGLVRLVDRTAGLLVAGTRRRARPMRALVGSHAARIVHDLEVPVLVVPLDGTRNRP